MLAQSVRRSTQRVVTWSVRRAAIVSTTVTQVLVASDSPGIADQVRSVLRSDIDVVVVESGPALIRAVEKSAPDLAVIDFQMGNMGGMATCLDLRLDESGGRLPHVPVLLMLDRRADVFLAKRASAEGWIIKPLDPTRMRRAIKTLLAGNAYHDDSYKPSPTPAAPAVS